MMSSQLQPLREEDDYQPIRGLNDLLFCERRCAMHRIEGVWTDNVHTLEGTHGHQRAHRVMVETAPGVRVVYGMMLRSERLRLVGKADVVEFRRCETTSAPDQSIEDACRERPPCRSEGLATESCDTANAGSNQVLGHRESERHGGRSLQMPFPVEYKRGRQRRWDNDDVQLCAQAMCLEEMLGVAVPVGAIFHVKSKRRREIMFTPELRAKTEETARRLHELVAAGVTPPPVLKPRCRGCSLRELCMPELLSRTREVGRYHERLFHSQTEPL